MAKNNVEIKITGDSSGFTEATEEANASLGKLGKGVGLAVAGVGTVLIGAAVGLEKLGAEFDDAYDTIAIATGATGDVLAGLQQSFDDVLSSGPYAFDEVADAISGLNQRVDLTGDPLEALSAQFLDLSRITDTDVAANIEGLTQVMNKWGVPADEMSGTLDELFRASQASGISMEDLAAGLTKFGAPLEDLGFSLEDSAALFASFEESGVNADQAMAGLTKGLVNMAKDGEDAPETLQRVIDEIANMEDPAAATALAVELFGAKAGPEMVAAIQSGAFEIEDYLDIIENGEGTISGTADATDDWREQLQTLKNKVLVKLKPLAEKVFGAITAALTSVSDWFDDHADEIEAGFQSFIDVLKGIGRWLADNKGVLIGALVALGGVVIGLFASWAAGAAAAAVATIAALAPFIAIGVAVAAVGAAFVWAYENVEWFRDAVDAVADFLVNTVWPALVGGAQAVVDWFQDHWGQISAKVSEVVGLVGEYVSGLVEVFTGIIDTVKALFAGEWGKAWESFKDTVVTYVDTVVGFIGGLAGMILPALSAAGGWLVDKGAALLNGLLDGAQAFWDDTLKPWLEGLPDDILDALGDLTDFLAEKGGDLLGGLWDGIESLWTGTIQPWAKGLGPKIVEWIGSLTTTLKVKGAALLSGLWTGMQSLWGDIRTRFTTFGPTVIGWVGDLVSTLKVKGAALLSGLWTGMQDLWGDIKDRFLNFGSSVITWIGNLASTLVDKGRDLLSGLATGAGAVFTDVKNWITGLPGQFVTLVGDLSRTLYEKGRQLIGGFISGIVSRLGDVASILSGIGAGTGQVIPPGIKTNSVRGYAEGGWVDARNGAPTLILAHGGEYVMNEDEAAGRSMRRDSPNRGWGGFGGVVTVNHYGIAATPSIISDALERARRAA